MKQITLSLLCAGLVALAACNKQKPMEPDAQPVNQSPANTGSVKKEKDPPVMFKAQMNKKTGLCWGRYGNCIVIKTIVITASAERILSDAAESGSSEAVAAAFADNGLSDLSKYAMAEGRYEKLISGKYYLTKTYDDGKEACFIASTMFPITEENIDFAFQFVYGEIPE